MDKKRLNFLYFLPILILLLAVNIFIDPASLTSLTPQEEIWTKEMLDGNIVFIKKPNINERKMKQKLIEQMPKEIDTLLLGPSLVKGIRKTDVGTDNYYNLGVPGADLYDILAQLGLIEINGVKVKKIILCIDTLLFDEKSYTYSNLHKQLISYSNYMIDILNNNQKPSVPNKRDEIIAQAAQYIENLFSITYFQAGIKYAFANKRDIGFSSIPEPKEIDIKKIDGPAFMSDGSYISSLKTQNSTLKDMLFDVRNINEVRHNPYHTLNAHMSDFGKETFEKIIQYYTKRGTKIELFLCPYPPAYWKILSAKNYPIINEQEEFSKELANKYNISITGSLNPDNVGIKDEDYYDSRHIRHEVLSKYFDFKK